MKCFNITYKNKKYKVHAKDSIEAVKQIKELKDDRLSPMTYRKLKELGYSSEDCKDWDQEQANEVVAKGKKETKKQGSSSEKEEKAENKSTENKKEEKKTDVIPWEKLKDADRYERQNIENEIKTACKKAYRQGHYVVPSFNVSVGSDEINIEFMPSYAKDDIGGFTKVLKNDLGNVKISRTKSHDWSGQTRYYITIQPKN